MEDIGSLPLWQCIARCKKRAGVADNGVSREVLATAAETRASRTCTQSFCAQPAPWSRSFSSLPFPLFTTTSTRADHEASCAR